MPGRFIGRFVAGFKKDERGAVAIWFVVALPAILAIVALSIDMSYAYFTRGKLQNTASSAALAGASQLIAVPVDAQEEADMKDAVREEARLYAEDKNSGLGLAGDYLDEANDVIVGNWDEDLAEGAEFTPNGTPFNAVQVTTRRVDDNALGLLVATVIGEVEVNTSAVAIRQGNPNPSPVCLLVLAPAANNALHLNGGVDIDSENCSICVNSSASNALLGNGNAGDVDLDFTRGGESGFMFVHGQALLHNTDITPDELINQPVCENPYETPPPEFADHFDFDNCSMDVPIDTGSNPVVIAPGVHCGNTKITGNKDIIFEAGVHHFMNGTYETKGNGQVETQDPGATILLTNTTLDWGGTKDYSMTANPVEGQNFLFYQNPADPTLSINHSFSGNLDNGMIGIQNFGHMGVTFNGGVTANKTGFGCSVLVAETVRINGQGSAHWFLDASGCGGSEIPTGPSNLVLRLVD